MTTIYLIRHAQADGNLYRRCQSWYDSLVTPIGYKQIEVLKNRFMDTHFDAVYSSDLYRTMTTAKAICEPHNIPLITDPELREINCGCWEDKTWGELLQDDRDSLLAFWRCDPAWKVEGGESFDEIRVRFDRAVRRIAHNHPNQTIALFAHGCVIRSALAYWLGFPTDQIRKVAHGDNTSVAKLEYSSDGIQVCWYNDIAHLSGELAKAPHPAAKTDSETAARIEGSSVYFHPFDPEKDHVFYLEAQADTSEGCTLTDNCKIAMLNGHSIGILQTESSKISSIGYIRFMYLHPDFRGHGLGIQLVGEAVSEFRALGFSYVHTKCCQESISVRHFLKKAGFIEKDKDGTFAKYIGY